jgi:hypothetical protein
LGSVGVGKFYREVVGKRWIVKFVWERAGFVRITSTSLGIGGTKRTAAQASHANATRLSHLGTT